MHKTANVLNKVALSVQANMKTDLREVYLAPNRASAEVAIDGEWYDVPNFALIDPKTNKLGYAVVWLQPRTSLQIQCFLPGGGAENLKIKQPRRNRPRAGNIALHKK